MTANERIAKLYSSTEALEGGTRVAAALFVERLRGSDLVSIESALKAQLRSAEGPFRDWLASQV